MADHKRPSLTVLGGPMAGTRFVLDDAAPSITVGSDPSSTFRLALPGVSPVHALLVIDASGVTIHDAGSARGVHVNDSRVTDAVALHNGDIVWLGTPGEVDVVMLQCILPRPPTPAPAPAEPPPHEPSVESETLALGPEALSLAPEAPVETPPAFLDSVPEPPSAAHEDVPAPPAAPASAAEFLVEESAEAVPEEPARFEPDVPPSPPAKPSATPTFFEDDTELVEAPPAVEEPEPTLLVEAAPDFTEPTQELVGGPFIEPTIALPAPHLEVPEPTFADTIPALPVLPTPPETPAPARAPAPPTAPAPRPSAAGKPTAAPRPPAPKREAPPSPRPRPSAAPSAHAHPPAHAPARRKSSSGAGLYVGLGLGFLALVGGGAFAAWKGYISLPQLRPASPSPAIVQKPSLAPLPPPPTPSLSTTTVPEATPQPPEPTATPSVEEKVTIVKPSPAPTLATPPPPSPSPSPKKGGPTPGPLPTPTPAEVLRGQQTAAQVASLLAQSDAAMGARQYDAALSALDEVLKLDPGNAKAAADRASAVSLRDLSRRKFVPGRTVVKTEKAAQDNLAGFDGAAVQKAPDFLGRIEFEMSPASGIRPGDNYELKFYLVNEGKKAIRVAAITVTTNVNGAGSGSPVTSKVRDVEPQQRALLGEASGAWKDGTSSWSAEVLVTANKGDSLKNQITWR